MKETNYWPLGVFLLSMVVVGLIVLTIKTSVSNPIELQNICGRGSQYIDENSNQIDIQKAAFLQKYQAYFDGNNHQSLLDFDLLSLHLLTKDGGLVDPKEVKMTFFLTRPHTTREDQNLGMPSFSNQAWVKEVHFASKGRWEAQALIEIGDDSICIQKEYFLQ